MKVLKAGLVGYGTGGEFFHAPFIDASDRIELAAVLERTASKSKEKYPNVQIIRNYQQLLNDSSIDIIVITTPNTFHFSMAKEAIEKGKHVVVDKPFTINSRQADELIRLAKDYKVKLTVFHNRRLDGGFQSIKKLIENGALGEVNYFEGRFDRNRPEIKKSWREREEEGAGLLFDLGSHLIDQALTLFGIPEKINAKIGKERPDAVVNDFFEIDFIYKNKKAHVGAGMLVNSKGPQFLIRGSKGEYHRDDLDGQEAILKLGKTPKDKEWIEQTKTGDGLLIDKDGKQSTIPAEQGDYLSFYQNLADAILENNELIVKPTEARNVIRMIELSELSNASGREVEVIL